MTRGRGALPLMRAIGMAECVVLLRSNGVLSIRITKPNESVKSKFVIPTRISCHASLDKSAYAPFRREGRMEFANATELHR
jgi:hypothetical protein